MHELGSDAGTGDVPVISTLHEEERRASPNRNSCDNGSVHNSKPAPFHWEMKVALH